MTVAPTSALGFRPTIRQGMRWQAFNRDAIRKEVEAGKVVFVDVTAAWCLTGKVNETAALDRGPVPQVSLSGAGKLGMKPRAPELVGEVRVPISWTHRVRIGSNCPLGHRSSFKA